MEPLTTGHWISSSNDLELAIDVGFVGLVAMRRVSADALCPHLKATVGDDERDVRPCWRNGVHKPGGRRRHSDRKRPLL